MSCLFLSRQKKNKVMKVSVSEISRATHLSGNENISTGPDEQDDDADAHTRCRKGSSTFVVVCRRG